MKEALAHAGARAQNAAMVPVRRLAMKPAAAAVARVPIRKLATARGRLAAGAPAPNSAAPRAPTPPSGRAISAGSQPLEIQRPTWEAASLAPPWPASVLPAAVGRAVVRREERRLPAPAGSVPCAGRLENRSQSPQADRSPACRQQCPATTKKLKKQSSLAEAAARLRVCLCRYAVADRSPAPTLSNPCAGRTGNRALSVAQLLG